MSRDFGQGRLDMVGRGELGPAEGGGDEGVVREEVDLARQAGGGLKQRFFGGRVEERELGAGQAEAMRDIAGQLVSGERGHVVADDDALRERLMDGHGEAPAQFGVAQEDEAEAVLGIHLVVGEEPQILQDIGPEVVRFVDHENRPNARIGAEAGDFAFDLPIERGAGAFDGQAHFPGDGLVEIHNIAVESET
jgi:hypothetical protein